MRLLKAIDQATGGKIDSKKLIGDIYNQKVNSQTIAKALAVAKAQARVDLAKEIERISGKAITADALLAALAPETGDNVDVNALVTALRTATGKRQADLSKALESALNTAKPDQKAKLNLAISNLH